MKGHIYYSLKSHLNKSLSNTWQKQPAIGVGCISKEAFPINWMPAVAEHPFPCGSWPLSLTSFKNIDNKRELYS